MHVLEEALDVWPDENVANHRQNNLCPAVDAHISEGGIEVSEETGKDSLAEGVKLAEEVIESISGDIAWIAGCHCDWYVIFPLISDRVSECCWVAWRGSRRLGPEDSGCFCWEALLWGLGDSGGSSPVEANELLARQLFCLTD